VHQNQSRRGDQPPHRRVLPLAKRLVNSARRREALGKRSRARPAQRGDSSGGAPPCALPFLGKIEQALPRTMNRCPAPINRRSRPSAGSDRRRSRKREGSCHDEICVAQSRYHRRHHSRGMRWYFDRCTCTCWPRRRPLRSFWEDGRGSLRRRGGVPALRGLSKRILWRMHRGRSRRFGTRPGPPLPYRRLHERMLIEILLPSLHLNVSGAYFRPMVFAHVARRACFYHPLARLRPRTGGRNGASIAKFPHTETSSCLRKLAVAGF
jgi:hypothetical protein